MLIYMYSVLLFHQHALAPWRDGSFRRCKCPYSVLRSLCSIRRRPAPGAMWKSGSLAALVEFAMAVHIPTEIQKGKDCILLYEGT